MKKFKETSDGMMKIIQKKGPNGFEQHEEPIENPNIRLQPMVEGKNFGWAVKKWNIKGRCTIHYFPKEENISFCGLSVITDELYKNKILFLTDNQKHSDLHKKCQICLRTLSAYRNSGYLPYHERRVSI